MTTRRTLTGWGRTAPTVADVVDVQGPEDVVKQLHQTSGRGVVARGLGRSYGDAAQNAGGVVLDLTGLDHIHTVDRERARVTVDAGVSLDTLMRMLLGFGLWLPVIPGTRQVTVGGAIASDVHGKNHHVQGSFANHVVDMDLLGVDGESRTVTPGAEGSAMFWATAGGMGLTGVVLRATLQLQRVETSYFVVDTERASDLDGLMGRLQEHDQSAPYSVAWFDALATGSRMGRGVITTGRSALLDDLPARKRAAARQLATPRLGTVPAMMPKGLVNRYTARAFNELWYRKSPRHRAGQIQNVTTFFHPLDVVYDWNRLYGRAGFCQYQFVVPFGAEDVVRRCTETIASSGHVSCLNVLKRFGAGNAGLLSFPTAGWTLAVDIPVRDGLDRLLRDLDELVLAAGGRVYLAKDARLTDATLARMYPRLEEFRTVRRDVDPDGVFQSDLSRRLDL